ncbi:hypothetical protein LX36DRAFT_484044 [Colletotrichum falcatum]|nr:hypothetical protein LX36DRAFT_484044 [Colletotrichum falcatum]
MLVHNFASNDEKKAPEAVPWVKQYDDPLIGRFCNMNLIRRRAFFSCVDVQADMQIPLWRQMFSPTSATSQSCAYRNFHPFHLPQAEALRRRETSRFLSLFFFTLLILCKAQRENSAAGDAETGPLPAIGAGPMTRKPGRAGHSCPRPSSHALDCPGAWSCPTHPGPERHSNSVLESDLARLFRRRNRELRSRVDRCFNSKRALGRPRDVSAVDRRLGNLIMASSTIKTRPAMRLMLSASCVS